MEAMDLVGIDVPGAGERGRKVGLLCNDLGRTVTDPAWLHERNETVAPDQIGEEMLTVDKPWQPRLHTVEERSIGKAVPLLASPRLFPNQFRSPILTLLSRPELAARVDHRLLDAHGRTLVSNRKLGQPIDLIAPQIDPDRGIGGARVHVNNGATHGDLTPVLNLALASIAEHDQSLDELDRVDLVSRANDDRFDRGCRVDALHQRSSRCHDEGWRMFRTKAVEHAKALTHRLDARTHPLKRQCFPRREVQDPIGAEHRSSIACESFGLGLGGGPDQHRPTIRRRNQAGEHQRATGITDHDDRLAAPESRVDRGLVAEPVEKVAERGAARAGVEVGHRDQRLLKRFIAASMSATARYSTASAASATILARSGRSAREGRFNTQSRPVIVPLSGLPTPTRSRENTSERRCARIDLRPLFPANPPPIFSFIRPTGRSSSSWTTSRRDRSVIPWR